MHIREHIAAALTRFGLENNLHGEFESFEINAGPDLSASYYLTHEPLMLRLEAYPGISSEKSMVASAWLYTAVLKAHSEPPDPKNQQEVLITRIFRDEEIPYEKGLAEMLDMRWYR